MNIMNEIQYIYNFYETESTTAKVPGARSKLLPLFAVLYDAVSRVQILMNNNNNKKITCVCVY